MQQRGELGLGHQAQPTIAGAVAAMRRAPASVGYGVGAVQAGEQRRLGSLSLRL
jgi:hypothetical protein